MNKKRGGSRAGARGGSKTKTTPTRGRPRKTRQPSEELDVFQEMLEEAGATSQASANEDGRTVKRRRIAGRLVVSDDQATQKENVPDDTADETQDFRVAEISEEERPTFPSSQIVYRDSGSESNSDESDGEEWENVNLSGDNREGTGKVRQEGGGLDLVFEPRDSGKATRFSRGRKGQTAAARTLRQEAHRAHIVALLVAIHIRNHWCNDPQVQVCLCS